MGVLLEVYDNDGNVRDNIDYVVNKWRHDFEKLYFIEEDNNDDFDCDFYNDIKTSYQELNLNLDLHGTPKTFNENISIDEVIKVVRNARNGKAVNGNIDPLPNEVFKNAVSIKLLHKLFVKLFEFGLTPNIFSKATINPIPKHGQSDPRIPLNYRGISLLSCVGKMYSAILNNRLMDFLEMNEILVEEQNGFRKGRSTVEHVFFQPLPYVRIDLRKENKHFVVS